MREQRCEAAHETAIDGLAVARATGCRNKLYAILT